jgi:hypothetical protein
VKTYCTFKRTKDGKLTLTVHLKASALEALVLQTGEVPKEMFEKGNLKVVIA